MKILYHKNIFHSANQITVSQVLQCTEFSRKPTAIGISTSTQLQESINGEKYIQFSYFFKEGKSFALFINKKELEVLTNRAKLGKQKRLLSRHD
jgi:hypothetical protein